MLHCSSRDESLGQGSAQVKLSANDTPSSLEIALQPLPFLPVGEAERLLGVLNLLICIKIQVPQTSQLWQVPCKVRDILAALWSTRDQAELKAAPAERTRVLRWKNTCSISHCQATAAQGQTSCCLWEKRIFIPPDQGGRFYHWNQFRRVWHAGHQSALSDSETLQVWGLQSQSNSSADTNFTRASLTHPTSSFRISSWVLQPSN